MSFSIGDVAISNHPYAFRSGEPYTIIDIVEYNGRECYLIQFADWVIDWFPTCDTENHQMILYSKSSRKYTGG